MRSESEGTIRALWLRPSARTPMQSVDTATAVAEQGLDGDHAVGGKRQLTILSLERWRDACAELGRELDPAVRRANVLTEGVPLDLRRGDVLVLGGDVRVVIEGETRPCELLDDDGREGLNAALRPDARAGVFGRIVTGGELRVGDPAHWESPANA